ncbi:Alpha/Beta hydrolase protein [Xylariaceae sp. FL1272]|nr:Alpha/Beta hydrolase protein [Xylariaceae sp. FL1272]
MDKKLKRAGFQEKDFHTGEVILNYVVGPVRTGPPIVFIHGQSVTWEEYTFIMPMLSSDLTVYAVSLRGHGKSSWTPGQYTFNALGKDMTAFLRQVVREPAIVVGNSSGGVLTSWLAANAKPYVKAIVLEDPPLFRCDQANITTTAVYDLWLALSRATVPNGGGFAAFYRDFLVPTISRSDGVMGSERRPPRSLLKMVGRLIVMQQMFHPGKPVDFGFMPVKPRIMIRGMSQFDGNFARAFVDGTVGQEFDHAETLSRIEVPVLFLHARYYMREDRLLGALTDEDVERVRQLVKGPWKYVKMDCGHAIALDAPEREEQEIRTWIDEQQLAARKEDESDVASPNTAS